VKHPHNFGFICEQVINKTFKLGSDVMQRAARVLLAAMILSSTTSYLPAKAQAPISTVPHTFALVQHIEQSMSVEKIKSKPAVKPNVKPMSKPIQKVHMLLTAYADNDSDQEKWVGQTASGKKPFVGMCAAPKQYPFGTKFKLPDGRILVAEDRGGKIQGHHLDVFVSSAKKADEFGKQYADVEVILPN
jgi:3D (Asp-Asp-Asp) domain-containing protein